MFRNIVKDDKQPVRKSSFWGIRCESGKKYSQIVNQKYHISMAALDPTSVKNGKEVVSLVVERDGSEFLLCNLQKDSVLQVTLNLFFDKGEKVVFSLKGQGIVHLTGYLIRDENEQNDENLQLKNLNDSIRLAKDKMRASTDANRTVQCKKNVSTLDDSWKVESKDKSSVSSIKNSASSAKKSSSINVSPSKKTQQKQLFKASQDESEDSSDDDDDDDTSEDKADVKSLQRFAEKRPLASMDDDDDDDDDEDDDDFDIDTSDDSDEEELPFKKKQGKDLQSNKKLKSETSTPLPGKKSALKNVSFLNAEDDSKNGDMNSSVGRTPMPKKKQGSVLQPKSALNESKKAQLSKDEDSSDSDSDDEMETSTGKVSETDKNKSASQLNTSGEGLGSEKKKKKKKKKKAKVDDSTAANESATSVKDTSFNTGSDLSKAQYSKKLPGGVEYEDIRQGNGPMVKKGRLAHVYYVGKLANNKVFDSCQAGRKPFVFKLGTGQVIKGWDMAVDGMKVGGKRRIKIPPQMGYQNQRQGSIPPNSTLYFVIELKAVS